MRTILQKKKRQSVTTREFTKTMRLPLVLFLMQHFLTVTGVNETHVATPTLQDDLISPGYQYNLDYGSNVRYDFLVYTNYLNLTLTLQVVDCEIERNKNGDCLYDHLYIYDGPDNSSTLLLDFCCDDFNPNPTITTTGNQSYLLFTTDSSNNYRGFKMSYVSTGLTTTTSKTTTATTSTTTTPAITATTTATSPATTATTTTATTPAITAATPATTATTTPTTKTNPTTRSTTTITGTPSAPIASACKPSLDVDGGGGGSFTTAIIGGAVSGGLVSLLTIFVVCLLKNKRPVIPTDRDT